MRCRLRSGCSSEHSGLALEVRRDPDRPLGSERRIRELANRGEYCDDGSIVGLELALELSAQFVVGCQQLAQLTKARSERAQCHEDWTSCGRAERTWSPALASLSLASLSLASAKEGLRLRLPFVFEPVHANPHTDCRLSGPRILRGKLHVRVHSIKKTQSEPIKLRTDLGASSDRQARVFSKVFEPVDWVSNRITVVLEILE
jgi:hypothetical protein